MKKGKKVNSVLINRWPLYLGLSLAEDPMRHHIDALSLTHLGVRRLGNVPTNSIPSSLIKGCPWTLIPVLSNMLLKLEKALRQRQTGAWGKKSYLIQEAEHWSCRWPPEWLRAYGQAPAAPAAFTDIWWNLTSSWPHRLETERMLYLGMHEGLRLRVSGTKIQPTFCSQTAYSSMRLHRKEVKFFFKFAQK